MINLAKQCLLFFGTATLSLTIMGGNSSSEEKIVQFYENELEGEIAFQTTGWNYYRDESR
jgi:hypothetical protein